MNDTNSPILSSSEHIHLQKQDCLNTDDMILSNATLVCSIKREEKKNALSLDMYSALADAIESANNDPEIKSIILTGSNGIFTSGNDLADFANVADIGDKNNPIYRFMISLINSQKPLIAAVDGLAIGIGTTLLLHCDFAYCNPQASFRMPFVNLGLVPEFASSLLVERLAGHKKACEWLLLGELFDAESALEAGLVNSIDPNPLGQALKTASKLAFLPPKSVQVSKALIKHHTRDDMRDIIDIEIKAFLNALQGDEFAEAVSAFFEKRSPNFNKCKN